MKNFRKSYSESVYLTALGTEFTVLPSLESFGELLKLTMFGNEPSLRSIRPSLEVLVELAKSTFSGNETAISSLDLCLVRSGEIG